MGKIHLYYSSSQKANKYICDLISMNGRLKFKLILMVYWDGYIQRFPKAMKSTFCTNEWLCLVINHIIYSHRTETWTQGRGGVTSVELCLHTFYKRTVWKQMQWPQCHATAHWEFPWPMSCSLWWLLMIRRHTAVAQCRTHRSKIAQRVLYWRKEVGRKVGLNMQGFDCICPAIWFIS